MNQSIEEKFYAAAARVEALEIEVERLKHAASLIPRRDTHEIAKELLARGHKPYTIPDMLPIGRSTAYKLRNEIDGRKPSDRTVRKVKNPKPSKV